MPSCDFDELIQLPPSDSSAFITSKEQLRIGLVFFLRPKAKGPLRSDPASTVAPFHSPLVKLQAAAVRLGTSINLTQETAISVRST
jgi:hypothetical protein